MHLLTHIVHEPQCLGRQIKQLRILGTHRRQHRLALRITGVSAQRGSADRQIDQHPRQRDLVSGIMPCTIELRVTLLRKLLPQPLDHLRLRRAIQACPLHGSLQRVGVARLVGR
ncbi:MAG: hypothetical protein R3B70_21735 [Polyangiaceae bacterium]